MNGYAIIYFSHLCKIHQVKVLKKSSMRYKVRHVRLEQSKEEKLFKYLWSQKWQGYATIKKKPIHCHEDTLPHCPTCCIGVSVCIKFITQKTGRPIPLRKSCQFKNENLYTDI